MTDTLAQDIVEGRRTEARDHALGILRGRQGVIQSLSAEKIRTIVSDECADTIGEDPHAPDAHTFGG